MLIRECIAIAIRMESYLLFNVNINESLRDDIKRWRSVIINEGEKALYDRGDIQRMLCANTLIAMNAADAPGIDEDLKKWIADSTHSIGWMCRAINKDEKKKGNDLCQNTASGVSLFAPDERRAG